MDFDLVPQFIIAISAGIILFIIGRSIPKAKDIPDNDLFEDENSEKEKFLHLYQMLAKKINKEKYQKKVILFWTWLEKILRKIRINFLKFDGKIAALLEKLREKKVESAEAKKEEGNSAPFQENNSEENKRKENMETENIKKDILSAAYPENKELLDEKKEIRTEREKECIKSILKNPLDIKSYWNLGIIYSRRRNYRDAVSCFKQIIKIDPNYGKAKRKISDLLEKMGKKNKANEKSDKKETNDV